MKPYYSNRGVTLYFGDNQDILPTIPKGSVDLLLTDPPYGVDYLSGWRGDRDFGRIVGDDGTLDAVAIVGQALRTLKRGRHLYVFGKYDLSTLPLGSAVELIWDKERLGAGDLSLPWGPSHEIITFAVYVCDDYNKRLGRGNLSARLRKGSVIHCHLNSQQVTRHPTEKPVALLRQLVESSTVLEEIVLDPFAGSGSTLVAAMIEGRNAIGIEVKEQYCEQAAKWLDRVVLPLAI